MTKKAIVIGATSGIGLEVARLLAVRGYSVGIAGRRVERLQEIVATTDGIVAWQQIDVDSDDAPMACMSLLARWAAWTCTSTARNRVGELLARCGEGDADGADQCRWFYTNGAGGLPVACRQQPPRTHSLHNVDSPHTRTGCCACLFGYKAFPVALPRVSGAARQYAPPANQHHRHTSGFVATDLIAAAISHCNSQRSMWLRTS